MSHVDRPGLEHRLSDIKLIFNFLSKYLYPQIKGLPFGNIFSVSDGPWDNSTGVPYFYMTPLDNSGLDLISFPFASLTFSEAQGDFCR